MGGKNRVGVKAYLGMVFVLTAAGLGAAEADLDGSAQLLAAVKNGDWGTVQSLLSQRVDVNAAEPDGATPLAWAVYRDDLNMTELLIRGGANVNAANDYGVTPLSLACTNHNATMVERLLKAGANPDAVQWTGETPLMTAARTGNLDVVKSLLSHGADVNATESRRGQTALMWAIAQKHPQVARLLIEHGADISAKSHMLDGLTPKVYLTYYGELQVSSNGGFTPLLFAAQQGDIETARLLLAKGANVNEATEEEGNALLLASSNGYEDMALFLLEHGGDPNSTPADGSGVTPLHYALGEGLKALMESKGAGLFTQIVQQEQQSASQQKEDLGPVRGRSMQRLMRALLARGADPNARLAMVPAWLRKGGRAYVSEAGATPFLLAAASTDVSAMTLLLESGANKQVMTGVDYKAIPEGVYSDEAQFQGSVTPLLAAAGLGRARDRRGEAAKRALETVKTLVAMGADVNEASDTGWTPLHAAAYIGAADIIEFLAEHGANLDAQNGCEQTPLSLADGSSARGLVAIPRARKSTEALLKTLGAGTNSLTGPVGRCVEGRYGIEYFTKRDISDTARNGDQ
jgi:ankyrin repeat protein